MSLSYSCGHCGRKVIPGDDVTLLHIREGVELGRVSGLYNGWEGVLEGGTFGDFQPEKDNINSAEAIRNSRLGIYEDAVRYATFGGESHLISFCYFLQFMEQELDLGMKTGVDFFNTVFGDLSYRMDATSEGFPVTGSIGRTVHYDVGSMLGLDGWNEKLMYELYDCSKLSGKQLLALYDHKKTFYFWRKYLERPLSKTGLLVYHKDCCNNLSDEEMLNGFICNYGS